MVGFGFMSLSGIAHQEAAIDLFSDDKKVLYLFPLKKKGTGKKGEKNFLYRRGRRELREKGKGFARIRGLMPL